MMLNRQKLSSQSISFDNRPLVIGAYLIVKMDEFKRKSP